MWQDRMFASRRLRIVLNVAVVCSFFATVSAPAAAEGAEKPKATFMTYNVYLGANLQPLYSAPNFLELVNRAKAIFAHLATVDFNVRGVAIARQIIEQQPDVVALQEASLWETTPAASPGQLTIAYDFLSILLDELARQGHPYRAVSVSQNFRGTLPIDLPITTLATYTDRNAIIVRADLPQSELSTSNPIHGVYDRGLDVSLAGTPTKVTRGWAGVDVTIRSKTYRVFNTHFEAFDVGVRQAQVGELTQIMSGAPYPTVLAGDINLYPRGVRDIDDGAWALLKNQGFRDAWVVAECLGPRFTAGQTDDLDNVPSNLDNTVDYVLFDKDFEAQPVEGSCDIAGEELHDRTDTTPALWPSDHAAVVVDMRIAKP